MKQISQNYRSGAIRLEQLDAPMVGPGQILVRSAFSVISTGTEGMKVREGKLSLLGKAKARPDHVKKVFASIRQQGLFATIEKVMNKLDSLTPLGYSLSGTVVAVGKGAEEFVVGQQVACAGAGYANHAELNVVPKNLAVAVPAGVDLRHAAFTTIGAIAMQGFRQSELHLGENACVIGLGLLGQLLVQMLRAAGVTVFGADPSEERCAMARRAGAKAALHPDDPGLRAAIAALTGGHGADCVFITAGGRSNGPVELAVEMARDRARIVDIGQVSMDIPWKSAYEKELDVRFSRSYGPGRYDPAYEEQGADYPFSYVRWTERRNMSAVVDLIAQGRLDLESIISSVHPFADAEQIYEAIGHGSQNGIGILFSYQAPNAPAKTVERSTPPPPAGKVSLGVIGAGNYASSMLLPILAKDKRVALTCIATKSGMSAANAARKFSIGRTGTDAADIVGASDVNAVLIATRHASHAALAAAALSAGKTVYVEKPLAVDLAGLENVRNAMATSGNDRLFVGFNRRFSPALRCIADFYHGRGYPLVAHYRVHAGQLEKDSWYTDPHEGSRFTGEGGHFIDAISFLIGCRPIAVTANSVRSAAVTADDRSNIAVTIVYEDGSLGNILYLTQGSSLIDKERLEVFGGGRSAVMDNFTRVQLMSGAKTTNKTFSMDKGQAGALDAVVSAIIAGAAMPIAADALIDTTLATLAVQEGLSAGRTIQLAEYWEKT
jgi:predicted dehydrogenase/threonine dehydrogenase-like Zn-dependent dehydrogenase